MKKVEIIFSELGTEVKTENISDVLELLLILNTVVGNVQKQMIEATSVKLQGH
jgi:hypothetical protein